MRFQCKIGTGVQAAPRIAPLRAAPSATPPKRPTAKNRKLLAQGTIASAVLVAAAGCATLDSNVARALKIEPVFSVNHSIQSSQAYYILGQYYDGSLAWDKSIDAYRKAIAVDANNVEAYNALGVALAQSGRHADAETTLRQAVALAPARTHIRNNLGYVLLLAGKPSDAVLELKAAVDQDGSNAIAKVNLRDAMARSSATQFGAAVASETLVKTPEPVSSVNASEATVIPIVQPDAAVALPEPPAIATAPQDLRVGFGLTPVLREERAKGVSSAIDAKPQTVIEPTLPVASPRAAVHSSRLEVSNGNGVAGMAARVGRWLATQGVPTDRLTNQPRFAQQQTVIQYRNGHEEAALRVARSLPANARAEPMPTHGLRSDVRVVLGRDWVRTAACLGHDTCQPVGTAVAVATNPN